MEKVISYLSDKERLSLKPPKVDEWVPTEEDLVFKNIKGACLVPVSEFYNIEDTKIDYFILSGKRCYNGQEMRDHFSQYMIYFEKFYDQDRELISIYCKIKYLLDYVPEYSKEALFYDLKRYILNSPTILNKIHMMNTDNYVIKNFSYTNKTNIALRYTDYHCLLLMEMSLLMNAIIPLLTHFMYVKSIQDPNSFLLEIFDYILHKYNVDMYNKLYETTVSIISKSEHDDAVLWGMQSIRGKNPTTHAIASVTNIILNIMPKYRYDSNIISLNLTSIKKNTSFQIVDISYELIKRLHISVMIYANFFNCWNVLYSFV